MGAGHNQARARSSYLIQEDVFASSSCLTGKTGDKPEKEPWDRPSYTVKGGNGTQIQGD